MTRLSPVKPEILIEFLKAQGFVMEGQQQFLIINLKILRDIEIKREDFIRWLEER